MRTIILILGLGLFSSNVFSKKIEISLGQISMMNNQVNIKIPTHFTDFLDFEIKKYYPTGTQPKVAYGDSLRECRLAFYMQKNEKTDNTVGGLKADLLQSWMEADLKLKELSNGIISVDGHDVAFLEVMHRSPEKYYHFHFLTLHKGLHLAGDLVCPKKGYKEWMPVAVEIMNSLDIK
ncbi:MAG: hypothetical protein IPM77_07170 [Crocinitomicaceae bacterium]|nr:hypothetical protein [Crocinitomicaceae bacterium]